MTVECWDGYIGMVILGGMRYFDLEEFLEKNHSDSAIFEISILELLDHPHVIHLVDVLLLVANSIQIGGVHASCKWRGLRERPWSVVLATAAVVAARATALSVRSL
jgi:hypothetical protein